MFDPSREPICLPHHPHRQPYACPGCYCSCTTHMYIMIIKTNACGKKKTDLIHNERQRIVLRIVFWTRICSKYHTFFFSGATDRGGPWPLYNTPPSLSIPCSISPSVYSHLSQVRGHVIQPSHFWFSSSSCCIQLSVHLFWKCGVLHSFYMTKPSYSLAFNEPDNVLPIDYNF